jgi:hypothetical protein
MWLGWQQGTAARVEDQVRTGSLCIIAFLNKSWCCANSRVGWAGQESPSTTDYTAEESLVELLLFSQEF